MRVDSSYQSVQSILSKGISRPTLYRVQMPINNRAANDQLSFLTKITAVPSISTNTLTANGHEAMGVVREVPTRIVYSNPFSITVISDRDYLVYKEMRNWFETLCSNGAANPNSAGGAGKSQRMQYFDSIARTITLTKLEQNSKYTGARRVGEYYSPFTIIFNNAYPVNIGELQLDSSSTDTAMEFSVDFAYETYTFDGGEGGIG